MAWRCFLIEPTGDEDRHLSHWVRARDGARCPRAPAWDDEGFHRGETALGRYRCDDERDAGFPPADDPRWPSRCACGFALDDGDPAGSGRASGSRAIYRRADTGAEFPLQDASTGALWDAPWMGGPHWTGPDGRTLVLRLPDGWVWCIDGPSSQGRGWERVGTPPAITARPSILTPRYHGWLTDGVLSDDLEGRTYD